MARDERLHFLNIDLELRSRGSMTRLLRALGPEMCVLVSGRGRNAADSLKTRTGTWARLELNLEPASTINACIREIARVVEALAPADRALWDRLAHRELCIGLDRDELEWAPIAAISAASIRRAAAIGCAISVVVYPLQRD